MDNSNSRIPDDMVAEVLAEAARLHAETNKSYSLVDLQQVCSEAQIPPHIVREALRNVEEKRLREQTAQRQWRENIKQQVIKGISVGIALLIPTIAVSSIFIFRSQFEPLISGLVSRFNPQQQRSQKASKQISPVDNSNSQQPKVVQPSPVARSNSQQPKVILREDFRNMVMGKTQQEVIQAVGRPDDTSDLGSMVFWDYDKSAKDPASGKIGDVTVIFQKDVVNWVNFSSY